VIQQLAVAVIQGPIARDRIGNAAYVVIQGVLVQREDLPAVLRHLLVKDPEKKWELWIACSRNIGIRNRRSIIFFIFRMENNFFTGEPPCPLKAADGIVLLFLLRGFFK
jgi:hypothetical protein